MAVRNESHASVAGIGLAPSTHVDALATEVRNDVTATDAALSQDPSVASCLDASKPMKPQGSTWASRRSVRALAKKRARAAKQGAKALPPLDPHEIVDRLRLHSTGLVEDIYTLVLRQIQGEDQRESRLDAKAQGLLVTSGLSLTVAFTFGGILLQHPEYFSPLGRIATLGQWPLYATVISYCAALIAGLGSSIYAVRALLVTDGYRATSERDVLDEEELAAADEEYASELSNEHPDRQLGNAKAQSRFRRHMAAHYWQIWQQHNRLHERKATTIGRGQRLFLCFLSALIVIGIAIGYSVLSEMRSPPANTPANQGTATGTNVMSNGGSAQPTSPMPTPPASPVSRPAPTSVPSGGVPVKRNNGTP